MLSQPKAASNHYIANARHYVRWHDGIVQRDGSAIGRNQPKGPGLDRRRAGQLTIQQGSGRLPKLPHRGSDHQEDFPRACSSSLRFCHVSLPRLPSPRPCPDLGRHLDHPSRRQHQHERGAFSEADQSACIRVRGFAPMTGPCLHY
jgi:hypothetical protein